jgi:predicted DNA binding CopG/RHH family protein
MTLKEAMEEARENIDKNYSTEPCVVEVLLIELKRARVENNHNWQANEYAEEMLRDNVRIGRALIKLSEELVAEGIPVPEYVREALNPVSLANAGSEPPRSNT